MSSRTSTTAKISIATARTLLAYCLQTRNGIMLRIAGEEISLHHDGVAYVIGDTMTADTANAIALLRSASVYKLTLVQTVSLLARQDWRKLEWIIPTIQRWACSFLTTYNLDDSYCEFTGLCNPLTVDKMKRTAGLID